MNYPMGKYKIIRKYKRKNKFNFRYRSNLTIYRKEKQQKEMLVALIFMIALLSANVAYAQFISLANSITIYGAGVYVEEQTGLYALYSDEAKAPAFVELVLADGTTLQSPSVEKVMPVMIENNEIENYIVKEAIKHGVNPDKALSVSFCESSFNLEAKNPNSTATGLWQFTSGTFLDGIRWRNLTGWTLDDRKDMKKSTDMAMWFVKREGWGRWECSKF